MRNIFVSLVFILFSTSPAMAYVNANAGEVVKVRGEVTQLRPGAWTANRLRVGDKLKEDTSILTGKRSFVSIRLADNSRINLGPNSKFVLTKMDSKEGGLISLLKGKIRAKVKKESSRKKNKLFIQTRSAAMGVRGTDFQTIYNPENRVTSMLTYKGKVAMVKVTDEEVATGKKIERLSRTDSSTELEIEDAPELPQTDTQKMSQLLESKEAVLVEGGQFSGTVDKIGRVSQPVKISPVQLGILYRNDEFAEKAKGKIKSANLSDLEGNPFKLRQAAQAAPPEGFFNAKTGEYAPKAGGVLDLESGLYLPPSKESDFDAKRQIYVSKGVGSIDRETGQYKAPKGLVLDVERGFVVDEKLADQEDLVAKANSLNTSMASDLVLAVPKSGDASSIRVFSSKERFAKESVYIKLGGFDHSVTSDNDPTAGNRTVDDSGKSFSLLWNHGSGSRWQLLTGIGIDIIDFGGQFGLNQKSDKLVNGLVGIRYSLSERWNVVGTVGIDQDLFIARVATTNGNSDEITKVATTKIGLGFEGSLIRSRGNRFSLDSEFNAFFNTSKSATGFDVGGGFGFSAGLIANYWFTSKFQAGFGPRFSLHNRDLEGVGSNSAFSADGKQDKTSIELSMGYLF